MTAKRVLIIDDDVDILDAIQLMLVSEGYEAQIATKGNEVSKLVDEINPDLIILDVLLSGNDGRAICRNLKHSKANQIPIIMISAHPNAKETAEDAGADAFVAKPFTVTELLGKIEFIIGRA